jgi:hypothetical protein
MNNNTASLRRVKGLNPRIKGAVSTASMGRRVVEMMLMGQENTRQRFEVDGRKPLGSVVREYLQSVAPQHANDRIGIMAETPNGPQSVDPNTTVDDLISRYGTDRIQIVPDAPWGGR